MFSAWKRLKIPAQCLCKGGSIYVKASMGSGRESHALLTLYPFMYRLGDKSPAERDLAILTDGKLTKSQQWCALLAKKLGNKGVEKTTRHDSWGAVEDTQFVQLRGDLTGSRTSFMIRNEGGSADLSSRCLVIGWEGAVYTLHPCLTLPTA